MKKLIFVLLLTFVACNPYPKEVSIYIKAEKTPFGRELFRKYYDACINWDKTKVDSCVEVARIKHNEAVKKIWLTNPDLLFEYNNDGT